MSTTPRSAKISVRGINYRLMNRNRRIEPVTDEVRLRHLTVDEAMIKLDKYLNDAMLAGLYQVRVIHGKGSGTIRLVARRQLAHHPLVKSYRPGEYGEGGAGVTIVELV